MNMKTKCTKIGRPIQLGYEDKCDKGMKTRSTKTTLILIEKHFLT